MNPAESAVSWYLRSMGDHDTHRGEQRTGGTVVATCGGSVSGVYVSGFVGKSHLAPTGINGTNLNDSDSVNELSIDAGSFQASLPQPQFAACGLSRLRSRSAAAQGPCGPSISTGGWAPRSASAWI